MKALGLLSNLGYQFLAPFVLTLVSPPRPTHPVPGALDTFVPSYTPGAAPHITMAGESVQRTVGIFLEAIPTLGWLVITTTGPK